MPNQHKHRLCHQGVWSLYMAWRVGWAYPAQEAEVGTRYKATGSSIGVKIALLRCLIPGSVSCEALHWCPVGIGVEPGPVNLSVQVRVMLAC